MHDHPFRAAAPERTADVVDARELEEMLAAARARAARKRLWMALALGGLGLLAVSPIALMIVTGIVHSAKEEMARRARRIDAAGKPTALAAIEGARKDLATADAAFRTATSEGRLAELAPGRSLCRVSLPEPRMGAGSSYSTYGSIDGNYFGGWAYVRLDKGAASITSTREWRLGQLEDALRKGTAEKQELASALGSVHARERLVLLQVAHERKPIGLAGGASEASYLGGEIEGRAYLYDEGAGGIVCVGDVVARNATGVDVRYQSQGAWDTSARSAALNATLERDLEVQLRTAIARSLREAVPRDSAAARAVAEDAHATDDPDDVGDE